MNQLELIFERLTPFFHCKPLKKNKRYSPLFFPKQVSIPLTREKYDFTFSIKNQKTISYKQNQRSVHFYGPVDKRTQLKAGMRKFLIDQSRLYILPRVEHYAEKTNLCYKGIRFKNQKSLWGSCSDLKNINFNIRLLFLPQELVDYVIVHELCHLEHMNHSKKFWNLVKLHCPAYKQREQQLNQANQYIPSWVFSL